MRTLTKYFKTLIKYDHKYFNKNIYSTLTKPPWKIMFFGSDEFSVSSLKYLNNEFKRGEIISTLEVVTSVKGKPNPVSVYATKEKLCTHGWPVSIPDNKFDLGIVVSFGHLIPEHVITKFHLGIINVHASLLPRWRGAAPIIHTIASEDTKTGVTIMKIQPKKFDVGEIVAQQEVPVPDNILMPDLYLQLAELGASLLISTLKNIPQCLYNAVPQPESGITHAPKVTPNMAKVRWDEMSAREVYALSRALYGLYPLTTSWDSVPVKLHNVKISTENFNNRICIPGAVEYRKENNSLIIQCLDKTCISCNKVGVLGKKSMSASDFNNGYLKKIPVSKRIFK